MDINLQKWEIIISQCMPKNWKIRLRKMPKSMKSSYWAFHRTRISKEGERIVLLESTIYLNLRDAPGENKVLDEIIHELNHLCDYSIEIESKLKFTIQKLQEEKK